MANLKLRQAAINDLDDIWEYTFQQWSRDQANQYYESIRSACLDVAHNPKIGQDYDWIKKDLKGCRANKHIVFYIQASTGEIEVIRILHERMDLKNRLKSI